MQRIGRLLAAAGETVHVIAQRWSGASQAKVTSADGRLVVHRVPLNAPPFGNVEHRDNRAFRERLLRSTCPVLAFAWQAAQLAEHLYDAVGIDVIEAPDWEAPLTFLAGRSERPLTLVHLHSSTEQVYAANRWDRSVADFAPLAAAEAATISRADALLCPSQYVAAEAVARYGLPAGRLEVVPYPLPSLPVLVRDPAVWESGAICHIGRLEPRKGVLELTDAWTMTDTGGCELHFAGGDTPLAVTGGATVGAAMRARLKSADSARVHFHGSLTTPRVQQLLARSWATTVPSRWDNLPYSCLEAMASGLPAIVSPHGGMKEIVRDGESGWVAGDATPEALAEALRCAVGTPPAARRAMGAAAAETVASACNPTRVLERHLALKDDRRRSVSRGTASDLAPEPLGSAPLPPAPTGTRFSAMARAVRRDGLPFSEWWQSVPADDRRQMVTTALRHPWRTLTTSPLVPAALRWTRRWE